MYSLAMFFPVHAYAETIVFVDQNNHPLENVVVEVVTDKTTPAKSSLAVVDQVNKAFLPELLVVQKGQSVEFPNSDNIRHHVYSFSKAKAFELRLYADKPEHPVLFEQPGVVVLGCNIHDSMLGYVYVAESDINYKSGSSGQVSSDALSTASQLKVWYPNQKQGPEYQHQISLNALETTVDGHFKYVIETIAPASRDTFADMFDAEK
jgi:plastocyanin